VFKKINIYKLELIRSNKPGNQRLF